MVSVHTYIFCSVSWEGLRKWHHRNKHTQHPELGFQWKEPKLLGEKLILVQGWEIHRMCLEHLVVSESIAEVLPKKATPSQLYFKKKKIDKRSVKGAQGTNWKSPSGQSKKKLNCTALQLKVYNNYPWVHIDQLIKWGLKTKTPIQKNNLCRRSPLHAVGPNFSLLKSQLCTDFLPRST